MNKSFNYWADNNGSSFLKIYWFQFVLFYFGAIWLAVKTRNFFIFLFLGFLSYLVILIYRRIYSPYDCIENGIKENDHSLYQSLMADMPKKYLEKPRHRAGLLLVSLLKVPEEKLDRKILSFKKNYYRVNKAAMISLSLWFFTAFIIGIYLYVTKI